MRLAVRRLPCLLSVCVFPAVFSSITLVLALLVLPVQASVAATPFTLRAVALTNSVVARWPDPLGYGFSNQTVLLRCGTFSYPASTNFGTAVYTGTNQMFTHAGLTPGQPYYYTIWCSHDGSSFVDPNGNPPPTAGPVRVFWFSTLGEIACWQLDTNGVFFCDTVVRETPVDPAVWVLGGFADINKDNRPELFWCPTSGVMKTWFLDENYQYSSDATLYGSYCPTNYQWRCAGDVTGNGFDALFFQDIYYGYIDSWHLRTNGTLREAVPTYASSVNRSLQLRACGDVSGDGRVELFFHQTNSGATEVWFMNTNGQQTAMTAIDTNAVPFGWNLRCAGDVNDDGRVELFWQHTNGSTEVWFMGTNGYHTASRNINTTPVSAGWRMVGTVDVNSDNRVELFWHNTNGATLLWFLNADGTFARQQVINSAPMDTKWRMVGGFTAPAP